MNQWLNPRNPRTGSKPGGSGPGSSARPPVTMRLATPTAINLVALGGREEGLRRTRGDAVGAQLDAHPVKRFMVNMGTAITLPAANRAVRSRESSSSADGVVAGRSPRSSPRAGKAVHMAKGGSEFAGRLWNARRSPVNTDASWPTAELAKARVLRIQTKLHQWATDDPDRRFDDLYNLVYDPAVLVDAWTRVRSNRGARSAGVDGRTARHITTVVGEQGFLSELRDDLKARRFHPEAVREVMIPKRGGKYRRLGIATVRDRVVQAALKTVLEPILEADFKPCSYGFRPGRRVQDAIAEIHFFTSRSYEWIVEGDIKACFDEISHVGVQDRLRARVADKRILDLVKAFLKAGILSREGVERHPITGTPQGGLVGSARGAWAARHVLARLAWFPPAATSNRACGSPAHGSPTFFTAGIQRPLRHGRLGRGATMVPPRSISPMRSGD